VPEPKAKLKTFSFGEGKFNRTSPAIYDLSSETKILNIELPLEQALKLILAINEGCRHINQYNCSTTEGKLATVNLAVHLKSNRIVVVEGKAQNKES